MLLNWFFISKSIDLFTFHFSLYFDLNKCRSNDLSSACSRCLLNVLRFPPSQAAESREAGENLISARDGICVNILARRRRRRRFLREHKMYNFRVSSPAPEGISPLPHINIFWCIIWRFSSVKLHATGYTHMEWFEMYTFLLAFPWSHECKYRSANVEHCVKHSHQNSERKNYSNMFNDSGALNIRAFLSRNHAQADRKSFTGKTSHKLHLTERQFNVEQKETQELILYRIHAFLFSTRLVCFVLCVIEVEGSSVY